MLLGRCDVDAKAFEGELLSTARTFLAEFRPSRAELPFGISDAATEVRSILVSGVPEPRDNPLEPLARYFLENRYEGDYEVMVEHTFVNPLSRLMASWKQKDASREAMRQQSEERSFGRGQEVRTVRDHAAEIRLEDATRELERTSSAFTLKVWVYVSGRAPTKQLAERIAEGAASVAIGALSGHRKETAIKTSKVKRVSELEPIGRPTLMLPTEAVPLFWIPQMAMGGEVAPTAEFEMPPLFTGEIELGAVVSQSGQTSHSVRLPISSLKKHLFLTAMTGGGKTTTAFGILMQLRQHGVPFLVIEPVKHEYRSLLAGIPELQVFTLGDEATAPFRLNIFEPPPGVKVQAHLENLRAAWNASFVMYAPLPYVITQILVETYERCGWDIGRDAHGRPIGMDDFRLATERVARRLKYEEKVTMNIEAALRARVDSLCLGGKGSLFQAAVSTPIERVLERPTVIELQEIRDSEEKAFVMALLVNNIVEYVEKRGGSRELRHVMVIEEAHELLPDISTEKGDPETADPRKRLVDQFAKMLATVRAYGEGIVIVEQIPTKILGDAIKNTGTKVVGRLPGTDDRARMAGAMNMTEEQAAVLGVLKPGEAVVHLEEHPLPIRVQVPDVVGALGIPVWDVPDEEVARQMAAFYRENPLPAEAPPVVEPLDAIGRLLQSRSFGQRFVAGFQDWLKSGSTRNLDELLVEGATGVSENPEEIVENTRKILTSAAQRYLPYRGADREKIPRVLMSGIERIVKGRGGD
jgi:DNA helicase HerA-like ATPase